MNDGHRTSTIPRPAVNSAPQVHPSRRRVDRPADSVARAGGDVDGERGGLLKDFTTPISRAKQIIPQRRGRLVIGVIATLIGMAIGAALFVLPVKSWLKQRDDLQTRVGELQTLDAANNQLQGEVDRLQTDDGIREAARTEIDYVPNGEKRVTVLPVGPASTALPAGWPYNLVTSIIAIRQAEDVAAAAAAVAATSVAPAAVDPAPVATAAPTTVAPTTVAAAVQP